MSDCAGLIQRLAAQRGAQPQPVDQRRQPVARLLGLLARQLAAELVHRVRQQAAATHLLQAVEHRLMHAACPEGQPGLHRRAAHLGFIKVTADNRLQTLLRAAVRQGVQAAQYRIAQLAGDVAHGRFQQTIFVFEIVTDDPRGNARPTGDLRDRRVMHSHFIYCFQRGVDKLPAPDRLHPHFGHYCHSIHQRWLTIKAVLIGRSI